jgi:small subunit ribosomal protein S19
MPRSVWKGPFFRLSLLNKINAFRRSATTATANAASAPSPQPLYTKDRASTIIPAMVGVTLQVHNGRDYIPLTIREEMVGMKIGSLVACRKPFTFRQTNAGKKAKK